MSLSDGGGSRGGPAIHAGKLQPTNEKIPTDLIPIFLPTSRSYSRRSSRRRSARASNPRISLAAAIPRR
jgi:hypothetical protein